jgi:lysophospholipase L1-like esterase
MKWGSIGSNSSVNAMIDPQCVNVGNGFFNQIDHDNDVHKGFAFTGNIVCESEGDHKRSGGYDVTTRLPNWTDNDDFRTYTVPCLKSGSFVAPLRADGDTTNCQLYFLNSEGKVVDNVVNSRETISTTYYSKDGQKITTNNGDLYSAGVRYITFTFRVTGTYKVIPSVVSNGAYQPSWLYSDNSSLKDNIEIIMPPKYAICGGIQSNVYYQNIVRYYNTKMLQMVEGSSSQNYIPFEYFARYTPSENSATDIDYKLHFYLGDAKNRDLETPWIHVDIVPKSSGSGITKKVMLIGDSITAYGIYSGELVNMFSNDVMNITLLGTQGSGANKTEGRYGWRAYTYCRCANGSDDVSSLEGTNPFYNNGHFDFSKYMTDQGYTGVDYVFINLGTNDLVRGNHASDADLKSYFDEMITSIHTYNSNIKIVVWLPPTRALYVNNNLSGINNALRMNKLLIDWYKNKESDKLFLCPVYINIDPYHDYNFTESNVSARNSSFTFDYCTDNVHPSDAGFYKIADMIYSEIKYLVTLE